MKRTAQYYIKWIIYTLNPLVVGNDELTTGKLNPLVVPGIRLMGLILEKINLILLIFEMTSEFNIQIVMYK